MKDISMSTAKLLFQGATEMGLHPTWMIADGLFVVETPTGERYINCERSSTNSHLSISLTINKYATRLVLQRHGLPNIPFCRPADMQEAEAFLATHKKIIIKPLRGAGSKGIIIVTDKSQLQDVPVRKYIFEKYISGTEMRYLILDGSVIAVHKSAYGVSVEADRELERISYEKADWDPELAAMAQKAARILNLHFGAVDYMIDEAGKAYVLEVNSAPGFKWFHKPTSGPSVNVAKMFLESTLSLK
jgi:glutathione synthase/RimK-type ligase-like ATP-grasp enzyme